MNKLAAPFTPHIKRQWVPTCLLLMHDEDVFTTMRFTACHVSNDPDVTYQVTFKVFGDDPLEPIWERESQPLGLTDVFSIDSREIAESVKRESLFCYVEEYSLVVERGPVNAILTLNSQAHYTSGSGHVHGHLGGFYIFGSPRKMLKGEYYYENFPGARVDEQNELLVYLLNPFTRPARYSVLVVDAEGRTHESPWFNIPGKGAMVWSSLEQNLKVAMNPCGVIVRSTLKLASFFAARDGSGRMLSMDHGHAFLGQVLKH